MEEELAVFVYQLRALRLRVTRQELMRKAATYPGIFKDLKRSAEWLNRIFARQGL